MLKLIYAALERAIRSWQHVPIADFERKQLETLRKEINRGFNAKHKLAKPASHSNFRRKNRT